MKTNRTLLKLMTLPVMIAMTVCEAFGAENLYVAGTTPAKMFDVVSPVMGPVTPVFFIGSDGARFMGDLDQSAVKRAKVSDLALSQYRKALVPETRSHGVLGYTLGGARFSGNEAKDVTCAIVVADEGALKTTSTMFHEAVHCKTFAELREDKRAFDVAMSFKTPEMGLTSLQYISYYHEALAAFLQVAYASNEGQKHGLSMIVRTAKAEENKAVSIGYRTARAALRLCGEKNSCPTSTTDLVRVLAGNADVMKSITMDMVELQHAAVSSGYVVAGQ